MQQVLVIHGGDVYNSYEAYLEQLMMCTVDPREEKRRWRTRLQEDLGASFEVFLPEMPNKLNAQYAEWKIWMDKYLPFLCDGVILIGHSLGGVFLAKYLSEERLHVSIGAVYLIAAPFFTADSHEGGSFRLDLEKLQGLSHKIDTIVIFHAKDDSVVPFSHGEAYATALPLATFKVFAEGEHFIGERFPELVASIKTLGKQKPS